MNRRRNDAPTLFDPPARPIDPGPPHERRLGCPCRLCCLARQQTAEDEAEFVRRYGMSRREHAEVVRQRAEDFRLAHPWRPS